MCDTIKEIEAFCEGYCGTRINPEYPACVEGEINKRFSALKARIAELEAMQKQMMNGCDGHCALDECVCEKDQRVEDLQDHVRELETMLASKDAVIGSALTTLQNIMKHQDTLVDGDKEFKGAAYFMAKREIERIKQALALTPADAVETARKKDELINKMLASLRYYNTFFGTDPAAIYAFEAIEAARAAGVTTEENQ